MIMQQKFIIAMWDINTILLPILYESLTRCEFKIEKKKKEEKVIADILFGDWDFNKSKLSVTVKEEEKAARDFARIF
jgi:hypothetical protein